GGGGGGGWGSHPGASFRFTWSSHKRRWLVWMDGSRAISTGAGQLSAPTVVIQRVVVGLSRFLEQGPMEPPDAHTVGSGTAVVLRDGKAYHARWSRPSANGGTTFTTDAGKPMTFARGPVWIVLSYGPGSSPWRSGKPVPYHGRVRRAPVASRRARRPAAGCPPPGRPPGWATVRAR